MLAPDSTNLMAPLSVRSFGIMSAVDSNEAANAFTSRVSRSRNTVGWGAGCVMARTDCNLAAGDDQGKAVRPDQTGLVCSCGLHAASACPTMS